MTNVLLLTYMFPPAGGIGTPRALAYTQHLPLQGCRVSVLAPTKPALRDRDPELAKLIPADVAVHRVWTPEPSMSFRDRIWRHRAISNGTNASAKGHSARFLAQPLRWLAHHWLFPDPQVLWFPFAYRKACSIIRREAIDAIIVNMPPFSLLKVAIALKRKFPHLKIITDFRDEWLGYYMSQIDQPTEDKVCRSQKLEAEAVRASTYVSTVTDTWVERLRQRYPSEPATKFVCTPNGYDPELFRDFKAKPRNDNKIVVTYFGTIHDNRVYSPENYLAAIESLPRDIQQRLETRFIGRIIGGAQQMLKQAMANVQLMGFMPKQQGISWLQETDFVLLIATDPSSTAGKLFEYLACGKPILALSPPGGEIDRLLRRTGTGWCADPWNPRAIQQMILSACRQLKNGLTLDPDVNAIRMHSWPQIMSRFAQNVGLVKAESMVANAEDFSMPMQVGV